MEPGGRRRAWRRSSFKWRQCCYGPSCNGRIRYCLGLESQRNKRQLDPTDEGPGAWRSESSHPNDGEHVVAKQFSRSSQPGFRP